MSQPPLQEGGRRRALPEPVDGANRGSLLRRSQAAAAVLLVCYLVLLLFIAVGLYVGGALFVEGLSKGSAANSDGGDTISGILLFVVSALGVGALGVGARFLYRSIRQRRVHAIRSFSLFSFLLATGILAVTFFRGGVDTLAVTWVGGATLFLIFASMSALISYGVNRSLNEKF